MTRSLSHLCKELVDSGDSLVNCFLGEMSDMRPETLTSIERGLRNKLMLFAADSRIGHAFRGEKAGANCFDWTKLEAFNIFLRIPADKIEEWSGAINLMYTQLIRCLERRPEKYTAAGANNVQTLLMMDEFARFGKLEMVTSALSTLRSKAVNICLVVQSMAQLDNIYSVFGRRIIFDNCQYQVILRSNDAETQKYLADLIGAHMVAHRSVSEHMNNHLGPTGYNRQWSETREYAVQPHELAMLEDILLLTPEGFWRLDKPRPYPTVSNLIFAGCHSASVDDPILLERENICIDNKGAKKMSIDERKANAEQRIDAAARSRRVEQRRIHEEEKKKKEQHRNFVNLCDEIDKAERRWDARMARRFIGSLPNELERQEWVRIVQEFVTECFVSCGLVPPCPPHCDHSDRRAGRFLQNEGPGARQAGVPSPLAQAVGGRAESGL